MSATAAATGMTDTAGDAFLEVQGLVKDYPGVRAADHVSLAIGPGEVVGLVGKNGAGKSTVIKILAGAIAPDEGRILLDGERGPPAQPS